VRLIAEFHGGSATASNLADDSGAVFTVRLPRR
jgi:signal transduction histidine kinase